MDYICKMEQKEKQRSFHRCVGGNDCKSPAE